MGMQEGSATTVGSAVAGRNEVLLVGRLSGAVDIRELPSGDQVAVWRLVVARPERQEGRAGVDTIDCESYRRAIIRAAQRWPDGVMLEVSGALRRRFWQSPAGARSRYAVDIASARRPKS